MFYREVDMSDLPSQYTEDIEALRQVLTFLTLETVSQCPLLQCGSEQDGLTILKEP